MQITYSDNSVTVHPDDAFSLRQTFECSQCFRWDALGDEDYAGVAFGRYTRMSCRDGILRISCTPREFDTLWRSYLDLDRDYRAIRDAVSIDERTRASVEYGAGIRILRQEPWEALCSFIISQCNNIPRIRGIISRLASLYGEEIDDGIFAFPSAETVASLGEAELALLRCGYRAPYISAAAHAVADGTLDLDALINAPTTEAKAELLQLPGVGEKVASCVLLFGLRKLDAFPVDTWMHRAVAELYGPGFDPEKAFGEYAGIAQQYLFYHARESRMYTKL